MQALKIIPIQKHSSLEAEVAILSQMVEELKAFINAQSTTKLEKGYFISNKGERYFVKPSQIIMIEAEGAYSYIHCEGGKKIFTSKTLKHWEEKFNSAILIRTHNSYLVNKEKIVGADMKSNTSMLEGGLECKISRRNKSVVEYSIC
jgi:two-component system, LytTR family, response regulator